MHDIEALTHRGGGMHRRRHGSCLSYDARCQFAQMRETLQIAEAIVKDCDLRLVFPYRSDANRDTATTLDCRRAASRVLPFGVPHERRPAVEPVNHLRVGRRQKESEGRAEMERQKRRD